MKNGEEVTKVKIGDFGLFKNEQLSLATLCGFVFIFFTHFLIPFQRTPIHMV
jgi:hypothetical protein